MEDARTLMQLLMAAVTTLCGVVGYLYREQARNYKECDSDRRKLWAVIARTAGMSVEDAKRQASDYDHDKE